MSGAVAEAVGGSCWRAGYGAAPVLGLGSFRGAATALQNYVSGQIDLALHAEGAEEVRFHDRNVRHLLTHLPSRETFEQLLTATAHGGGR